jgi:hypothetical protein
VHPLVSVVVCLLITRALLHARYIWPLVFCGVILGNFKVGDVSETRRGLGSRGKQECRLLRSSFSSLGQSNNEILIAYVVSLFVW